jgi:hypothetical protein
MPKYILAAVITFLFYQLPAQNGDFYYQDAVFKDNIKSVKLFRNGFELSDPVMEFGENISLVLKFDDISGKIKNYSYTIVHCDADWNESYIAQSDYLEGMFDNPLNDYAMSFNTTFPYVNYQLVIPNENIRMKLSGNYALVVYEDNSKKNLVLSKRFSVIEPKTTIEGSVRRATLDAFKGENHEIDFTVFHPTFRIENPLQDIKVVIRQNNRWDNAIRNLRPMFIRDNALVYDFDKENVFPAGNEFRYFDIRTTKLIGEGVLRTDFMRPYYHVTLLPDEPRVNKKYFPVQEMNGEFVVESQDRGIDDFDTQCDYVFVHFSLYLPSILTGGTINVFGAMTNWNANKSNEMTWNFNDGCYQLTLLLKQGYYNFQYAYVEQGSPKANLTNIEGSFWETNNDYQIMVYYRDIVGRYDRLIGYTQISLR